MKIIYLEFQKIFKFLFFSIIFININLSSYAQNIDDKIKPSCKSIFSEKNFKNLSIFENINIFYNESKIQKKIGTKYKELRDSNSSSFYISGQLKKNLIGQL